MSTRCQIGFYDEEKSLCSYDTLLYRHSDGYPYDDSGVLADIVPFLRAFDEKRGLDDTEYAAAWCMHHLIQKTIETFTKLSEKDEYFKKYDGWKFLGHGVCGTHGFHGDIEYYYAVSPGKVRVFECRGEEPSSLNPNGSWKLIYEVDLNKEFKIPTEKDIESFKVRNTVKLTPVKPARKKTTKATLSLFPD